MSQGGVMSERGTQFGCSLSLAAGDVSHLWCESVHANWEGPIKNLVCQITAGLHHTQKQKWGWCWLDCSNLKRGLAVTSHLNILERQMVTGKVKKNKKQKTYLVIRMECTFYLILPYINHYHMCCHQIISETIPPLSAKYNHLSSYNLTVILSIIKQNERKT